MYQIVYTKKADQDIEKLEKQISKRIIQKIYEYSLTSNPLLFAKRLNSFESGSYRFRIGDYRAIFDLDHQGNIKILMILRIKHRKDVYKD